MGRTSRLKSTRFSVVRQSRVNKCGERAHIKDTVTDKMARTLDATFRLRKENAILLIIDSVREAARSDAILCLSIGDGAFRSSSYIRYQGRIEFTMNFQSPHPRGRGVLISAAHGPAVRTSKLW